MVVLAARKSLGLLARQLLERLQPTNLYAAKFFRGRWNATRIDWGKSGGRRPGQPPLLRSNDCPARSPCNRTARRDRAVLRECAAERSLSRPSRRSSVLRASRFVQLIRCVEKEASPGGTEDYCRGFGATPTFAAGMAPNSRPRYSVGAAAYRPLGPCGGLAGRPS